MYSLHRVSKTSVEVCKTYLEVCNFLRVLKIFRRDLQPEQRPATSTEVFKTSVAVCKLSGHLYLCKSLRRSAKAFQSYASLCEVCSLITFFGTISHERKTWSETPHIMLTCWINLWAGYPNDTFIYRAITAGKTSVKPHTTSTLPTFQGLLTKSLPKWMLKWINFILHLIIYLF